SEFFADFVACFTQFLLKTSVHFVFHSLFIGEVIVRQLSVFLLEFAFHLVPGTLDLKLFHNCYVRIRSKTEKWSASGFVSFIVRPTPLRWRWLPSGIPR